MSSTGSCFRRPSRNETKSIDNRKISCQSKQGPSTLAQSGMFVWAKTPKIYSSGYELSDQILIENAVFITPGGIFGSQGNEYIRISLCAKEEVFKEVIQRIKSKSNGI